MVDHGIRHGGDLRNFEMRRRPPQPHTKNSSSSPCSLLRTRSQWTAPIPSLSSLFSSSILSSVLTHKTPTPFAPEESTPS